MAGPLPPPWSGIGVSLQHLVESKPLRSQDLWVVDTSARGLPGDPGRAKLPTPRRLSRHAGLAARTRRLIRARRIDVFHLHGSSHDLSLVGNALSILSARAAGARTVWHLHEDLGVVAFPGRKRSTQGLFSALMRLPDRVAVLSDRERSVAAAFIDPRRVAVLPPTCSPELARLPTERTFDGEAMRVLFVGWLTHAKGIYDLLHAARALRQAHPTITFAVVGTGMSPAEAPAVQAAIERDGLQSHVRLCGVLTGEAKQAMFAQAHVLCLPTHWDAFPVVILEAMAAGLPIVATRVGGVPHMVEEGRGALLCAPGDSASLADDLVQLARDPQRRVAMGQANRARFLSAYHPDAVGLSALELYRGLSAGRPDH